MKFFLYGYVLLLSVLMCFASNDNCVDSVTSKALDEIRLNRLILDDNCKNHLLIQHKAGLDDNGVSNSNIIDDNGVHFIGTDDNGNHNGTDDNGVHQEDSSTCSLILSGDDGICNKVRAEHNDLCGLMTDDDCIGIVKNIPSNLIASVKNSGNKIVSVSGILVASQLLFAVL